MANTEGIIYLSNVRLSFPHIAEPQRTRNEQTGQERISYNGEFIMEQSHPGFQQFMKLVSALAAEKWKEHAGAVLEMCNRDRKQRCYGSGNEKIDKKTMLPYAGYAGHVYITAGRDKPCQVIQADGSPVDPDNTFAYNQITRKLYGGCRVNAAVKPWLQDNKHGRGVRCDLVAIQFAGDDTPFGAGEIDASDMFGSTAQPEPNAPSPAGASFPFPGAPGLPSFLT